MEECADTDKEEDLTTQLFHRELLRRFSASEVLTYVQNLALTLKQHQGTGITHEITVRLEFQLNLLQFLQSHTQYKPRNAESVIVSNMHDLLSQMKQTSSHGRPVPDSFSTKIQRRLASTMPPRPQVTVEIENVWSFWQAFIRDCQHISALTWAENSADLLEMYHILAAQRPQLSTYPRALLQKFVDIDGQVIGTIDPDDFILYDVRTLTWPTWTHPKRTATEEMLPPVVRFGIQEFLQLFRATFMNLLRALSLNSCRIRRNLCHAVVEWDQLQGEVEEIDSNLQRGMHDRPLMIYDSETHAFALSSWVYHHKLSMMRTIVQLGFEQEIYARYELASMYYYLNRLCDTHLAHLERISHFVDQRRSNASHLDKNGTLDESDYSMTLKRLYHEYAVVKATSLLAQALQGTFLVLQRFGACRCPTPVHSSDKLRYEIRMKPFSGLSVPEMQSLDEFKAAVERPGVSTRSILQDAIKSSSSALTAWQEVLQKGRIGPRVDYPGTSLAFIDQSWRQDVQSTIKVATVTAEHCQTLLAACDDEAQQQILARNARVSRVDHKEQLHRQWTLPVF